MHNWAIGCYFSTPTPSNLHLGDPGSTRERNLCDTKRLANVSFLGDPTGAWQIKPGQLMFTPDYLSSENQKPIGWPKSSFGFFHNTLWRLERILLANPIWYSAIRGFPGGSDSKEFACSVGDPGSIPGLGRSPGKGNRNPLQYCLENPMDGGIWQATVHKVVKSWTQLSD